MLSSNVLLMFKQGTPLGLCLISLGVRGIYSFVFFFKQKGLPITTVRREPTPLDKQTCLKCTHVNPFSLAPGEEKSLNCVLTTWLSVSGKGSMGQQHFLHKDGHQQQTQTCQHVCGVSGDAEIFFNSGIQAGGLGD